MVFGGNFTGAVGHLGGTGGDTLTGTAAAETFVAGTGNEDWHHPLEAAGVRGLGDLGGLWFSNYSNVVPAARDGHGIAIGWRHVIEKHLKTGELVNPTGKVFKTGRGFYLLKRQASNLLPAAVRLHDWLLGVFKE